MAVVALAILDDAFGHPEPGTTAGDHLVSGLVPVAIAAGARPGYPRLRAGLRGAVALVCGVLAMTAGVVDGFRHVAVDTLAGDDVTGHARRRRRASRSSRSARSRCGARADSTSRRCAATAAARSSGSLRPSLGFLVVFPVAFAIAATHRARSAVRGCRPRPRVSSA